MLLMTDVFLPMVSGIEWVGMEVKDRKEGKD